MGHFEKAFVYHALNYRRARAQASWFFPKKLYESAQLRLSLFGSSTQTAATPKRTKDFSSN